MPRKNDAGRRFVEDMKREQFANSLLGKHIVWLRSQGKEGAEAADLLEADLIDTFTTESGLRVMKLFEKSVLYVGVSDGAPDSALREMNAVRNFVLEIRRYVSNG